MFSSLMVFLLPLLKAAQPELQAIGLAWLRRYRAQIEAEVPGIVKEIEDAVASHDDHRVSQLLHRLRAGARG